MHWDHEPGVAWLWRQAMEFCATMISSGTVSMSKSFCAEALLKLEYQCPPAAATAPPISISAPFGGGKSK
ncbi:MAG: hypothetical protein DMG76_32330 [Acidobacteria bacterium]|nr:MAG: hypothetical protein DMG76_32330 [Acidobacteriota bacterium]